MRSLLSGLAVLGLAMGVVGQVSAETRTYNFESGIDSDFSMFKTEGVGWTVATDSGELRIAKPEDDLSVDPGRFVTAGIRSDYFLAGDFMVTVDFRLVDFSFPGTRFMLNESILGTWPEEGGASFMVLRFKEDDSEPDNYVEVYDTTGPHGKVYSSVTQGKYRVWRQGNLLVGEISSGGGSFTEVWSGIGYTEPAQVSVYAAQGLQGGTQRSSTSLDIGFDNLDVQADAFVPEPSAFTLVMLGFVGLTLTACRRRTGVGS